MAERSCEIASVAQCFYADDAMRSRLQQICRLCRAPLTGRGRLRYQFGLLVSNHQSLQGASHD